MCAASTARYFVEIRAQFERLQQLGPNYGYFPESSEIIRVVTPHNVEQAKVELAGLYFQVEICSRYLGSFIGEATEQRRHFSPFVVSYDGLLGNDAKVQ